MSYQHKRFHQSPIVEIGKYLEPRRDKQGKLVINRDGKARPGPCLSAEVHNRFSIAGSEDFTSLKPVLIKRQSQAVQVNGEELASRCERQTIALKPSFINSEARAIHHSALHPALIFIHEVVHKRTTASSQAQSLEPKGLSEAYPPKTEVSTKGGQDKRIERYAQQAAKEVWLKSPFAEAIVRLEQKHKPSLFTLKTGR